MVESKRRSLLKSATWRLTALIVLGLISYLITGNLEEMKAITALYTVLQVAIYFMHERLWTQIAWGQKQHPLAYLPVNGSLHPSDLKMVEEQLRALGYMGREARLSGSVVVNQTETEEG